MFDIGSGGDAGNRDLCRLTFYVVGMLSKIGLFKQ